ncbi:hypothetical protein GCM10009677_56870 [Sphaerisporangium rubeum]
MLDGEVRDGRTRQAGADHRNHPGKTDPHGGDEHDGKRGHRGQEAAECGADGNAAHADQAVHGVHASEQILRYQTVAQ